MQSSSNSMQTTSLKKLNPKKCCSHTCPRSTHLAPGQQLLVCSGCKAVSYCDRQCQKDAWALHKSLCKLQRRVNNSEPVASDQSLPPPDSLVDLLKKFTTLHQPAFAEATVSCIISRGGPQLFDFPGHVMFFGLDYRNDNPGTAFSISFSDCLPISLLYKVHPDVKEMLQASDDKYNSVADFDKATMEHFAGLIRVVFQANGCLYIQNIPIRNNPKGDAANRANWRSDLQFAVDNGLVAKDVAGTVQMGKIVKQGSHWKWVSLTGRS